MNLIVVFHFVSLVCPSGRSGKGDFFNLEGPPPQ